MGDGAKFSPGDGSLYLSRVHDAIPQVGPVPLKMQNERSWSVSQDVSPGIGEIAGFVRLP